MPKFVRSLVVLAVALFATQPFARGQGETTSAIAGSVSDQTGSATAGAAVVISSPDNGFRRSVKTDDAGRFSFPQLKPGVYSVKVEAEGFEIQERRSVVAGLGQTQTVNFA